ncbi:hypothetical protein [Absidia glauca]|uniref:Protein kinase domain-containing protein n=1 Tax=Absidia glauca TaxID=4829 RepID=A0A163ISR4_ABSGL|nr:hypothetical protein [Absidia glauca]
MPGDSHINKQRHSSIPLSALKDIQRCGKPQDTNYIGITITDQEETVIALDTTWTEPTLHQAEPFAPQTYRHSFNNLNDLVNLQRQQQSAYSHAHNGGKALDQQQEYLQVEEKVATLDLAPAPDLTRHSSMVLPRLTLNQSPSRSSPSSISHQDLPSTEIPLEHATLTLSAMSLDPDNAPSAPPEWISAASSSSTAFFTTSSISPMPLHTNHQQRQTPIPLSYSTRHTLTSQTMVPPLSHQQSRVLPTTLTSKPYTLSKSGAFRKTSNHHSPPLKQKPSSSSPIDNKPLLSLTKDLHGTYQKCNHGFLYNTTLNPRRVLTKPSKPGGNDGYDNEECDYILYVNDILGSTDGHRYIILDVLGAGTFGQVVKCKNVKTQELVAVKVVKNKLAYFKQSMMEVTILEMHHILRLKDTFIHRQHLCLIFELMSVNLYELIKQNHFHGLSTNLVRVFTAQILDSLAVLNEARVIHCDLKPENILLRSLESPTIKVIDFGSACHEVQTVYTYIQSRFYRSPEVLVGLPYTSAIDMWSLGCIAAELFLGLPLFPGSSEYNQVSRIVDMLGLPPAYMIEMGKTAHQFFDRRLDDHGQKQYHLKSMEQYAMEQDKQEQPSKRYFKASTLAELITTYPMTRKDSMSPKELEKEAQTRHAFVDFLHGLLNMNHFERWSPQQAKQHPFITGEPFIEPFTPSLVPPSQPTAPQLPLPSADSSTLHNIQTSISSGPDESCLSPSHSSLPNFYTIWPSQPQPSTLSPDPQLAMHYEEVGMNLDSKSIQDRSNYTSYHIPQVLETRQDGLSNTITTESTFMPNSSPRYHHAQQTNHHDYHEQLLPLSSASTSANPDNDDNKVNAMQVPSSTHLAILNPVTGGADDLLQCHLKNDPTSITSCPGMAKFTDDYRLFAAPDMNTPPTLYHHHTIPSSTTNERHPQANNDAYMLPAHLRLQPPQFDSRNRSWRRTRNMSSIDLERDADWTEERPSPHLTPNANHRRSHSSNVVPSPFNTSMLSRPSMVSLHRRVRGHSPLLQTYHRQDLEWDGVHTILPY